MEKNNNLTLEERILSADPYCMADFLDYSLNKDKSRASRRHDTFVHKQHEKCVKEAIKAAARKDNKEYVKNQVNTLNRSRTQCKFILGQEIMEGILIEKLDYQQIESEFAHKARLDSISAQAKAEAESWDTLALNVFCALYKVKAEDL